jgi:hypothetical protein
MTFQIVRCEVRWVVKIGYSGNELPPSTYESLGPFETERDAEQALADTGFTRKTSSYWKNGSYGEAWIARTLKELQ